MGQIANALLQRPQGQLPSDTEANPGKKEPNHQVHAVTLRSGKSTREEEVLNQPAIAISEKQPVQVEPVEEAEMQAAEKEKKSKAAESQGIYPPPPFPGRLSKLKEVFLFQLGLLIEEEMQRPMVDIDSAVIARLGDWPGGRPHPRGVGFIVSGAEGAAPPVQR
ncbi:hypothetical protein POM88_021650 [Heracleum sosnowskyi]|uniref:Uncharacterized protein n=1 Tax=Heracleum sosnowskyi TaxID=360622 RepID=A0AAD8IDV7_9APIA|nr:hypothetical protein POM88_021650 [Heracleum sosnowskyi]